LQRSTDRILTTHVGRLQRPEALTDAMGAHPRGRPTDAAFGAQLKSAVAHVVKKQADTGIDIVNDGEFGKLSWLSYLNGRMGGHEQIPVRSVGPLSAHRDRASFGQFYKELEARGSYYYSAPGQEVAPGMEWACVAPVSYIGHEPLQQDIDNLTTAAKTAHATEAFLPATSPVRRRTNAYYKTEDDYYQAAAEAMRTEYKAIIDAGIILQIDDPGLPTNWESSATEPSLDEYRKSAQKHVDVLKYALKGLPEDRIRYHICWGSWHGAHLFDIEMKHVVEFLLQVPAQAYVIEAANARHEHEWMMWKDVKLPDGKILIPGVVAHATNGIEHPELVAWRIRNFASVVGRENVIAGTDCGLGYRVHDQIAWAKLKTLAEGARLASKQLW
jgi:5-methyltetrahydropteroyltriglutamate--homocysteine methyltransferase